MKFRTAPVYLVSLSMGMLDAFGLNWSILFPVYALIVLIGLIWLNSSHRFEKYHHAAHHASSRSCFRLLKTDNYLPRCPGFSFIADWKFH